MYGGMRARKLAAIALAAAAVTLVAAGSASAASTGQLTAAAAGANQVHVTGSATYDCAETGNIYCGWFPTLAQVGAGETCANTPLLWVGTSSEQPTQAVDRTFTPYGWYGSQQAAFKLCLYVNYPSYQERLVAETVYTPPPPSAPAPVSPAPAPVAATPTPPSCSDYDYQEQAQADLDARPVTYAALDPNHDGVACERLPHRGRRAPSLSKAQAAAVVSTALRRRLGGKFTRHRFYRVSCGRLSASRVRCRASWIHRGLWHATVTVHTEWDGSDAYYVWTSSVKAPARPSSPSPSPPVPAPKPKPTPSCNPAYPTVCIPNVPYDLDCPEISAHDFAVPGDDPYGFDGDNDGVGCET